MKIEILGTGCPKCEEVYKNVQTAVNETGIENVEIVKVTSLNEIMNYGVMLTPALVIDGEVKASGKISSVENIKQWIKK